MKETNLETVEAVTHTHYTFGKINSNALLKIGEFLSLYKKSRSIIEI